MPDHPPSGWKIDLFNNAMNDGQIEAIALVKLEHRAFEDCVKTALGLPAPKDTIDARGVDLAMPMSILLDG